MLTDPLRLCLRLNAFRNGFLNLLLFLAKLCNLLLTGLPGFLQFTDAAAILLRLIQTVIKLAKLCIQLLHAGLTPAIGPTEGHGGAIQLLAHLAGRTMLTGGSG